MGCRSRAGRRGGGARSMSHARTSRRAGRVSGLGDVRERVRGGGTRDVRRRQRARDRAWAAASRRNWKAMRKRRDGGRVWSSARRRSGRTRSCHEVIERLRKVGSVLITWYGGEEDGGTASRRAVPGRRGAGAGGERAASALSRRKPLPFRTILHAEDTRAQGHKVTSEITDSLVLCLGG